MTTSRTLPGPVAKPAALKSLRSAVANLGTRGIREVEVVRQAFVSGVPPIQTFSSGSKYDFINRFAGEDGVQSEILRSTAQMGLHTAVVSAPVPPPRPELDFIEVGFDRSFGVLDSFFSRVVFSMANVELSKVSYFRVLRARAGRILAPTPSFSALADSSPLGARSKSSEASANAAFRAAAIGVGNSLTDAVHDDEFSRQRAVISTMGLRTLPPVVNSNRRSNSAASLLSLPNGDRSVVEDVVFYVNQRTIAPRVQLDTPLTAGQKQGINVLQGSSIGSSTSIVSIGNSMGFSEVARLPVSHGRRVGAFTEYEYWDPSVIYGAGYSYYVVAVSKVGFSSVRSRIVQIAVTRTVPPPTPDVMFAVLGNAPRFSISCSGSFTDHIEIFRRGGPVPVEIQLISTRRGMIDAGIPTRTDAGFYHIGDIGVGPARTSTFVDRNMPAGQTLDYRIYSVDSFGLKSSTPFSCSISLPDYGKVVPLGTPAITAEQTTGDRIAQISVSCEDTRVTSFVLTRRELTTKEQSYRQPSDPAYFTFGETTVVRSRSRSGPALSQFSSKAWSGILRSVSGLAKLTDTSVEYDRIYQYSVKGVDVRGNFTANVPATPVFIAVKPISDAPTAVTGTVVVDSSGNPSGVLIRWTPGTIDFSPMDLIGDQNVLAASSQRSIFQVERRVLGSPNWVPLPATTGSSFFDPVSNDTAPKFRPAFVSTNKEYDYRVIAMQSGAFISTHTDPVRVAITPEIAPPLLLFVRSTDTAVRPLSIVLSWQYDGIFVDGWEVERAVTNKLFGARIPSMDSVIARGLSYSNIGKITRESSRGLAVSSDGRPLDPKLFGGNRSFIDRDVSMANSYFYRIRALDAIGRTSAWIYGGVLLTDSPFDRKFMSALSDSDKSRLSLDPRPLPGWEGR